MTTLRDLGEREIIRKIIAPFCTAEIGDDCAEIARKDEVIIVTTDPVPSPAAEVIGGDDDPYWKGWLLTTINASDLAAAAAKPLSFFVAAEAPSDLLVEKFQRFFKGVADACDQEGLIYAGGNLREGQQLSAVGTAIGTRPVGSSVNRRGITDGDLLVIVGNGGAFWLDALRYLAGDKSIDKRSSHMFSPRSESRTMRILADEGIVIAAMDNSDGLLPTIQQLAEINQLSAILELDKLYPPAGYDAVARLITISHERLWLGWGDWNIVIAVKPDQIIKLEELRRRHSLSITVCGHFDAAISTVQLKYKGVTQKAPRLDSERFAKDSWFTAGIDAYIDRLRNIPLPGNL